MGYVEESHLSPSMPKAMIQSSAAVGCLPAKFLACCGLCFMYPLPKFWMLLSERCLVWYLSAWVALCDAQLSHLEFAQFFSSVFLARSFFGSFLSVCLKAQFLLAHVLDSVTCTCRPCVATAVHPLGDSLLMGCTFFDDFFWIAFDFFPTFDVHF